MKKEQIQFTVNTIKVDPQKTTQINLNEQNNIIFLLKAWKQIILDSKCKNKMLLDINFVQDNELHAKIQEELIKEAQDFNNLLLTEFDIKFL